MTHFLKTLPEGPGVYKMVNAQGRIVYIGKARHLKHRVASYFRPPAQQDIKTNAMMSQVHHIEIVRTTSENEALVLEDTLIKAFRPRYNILLRDDKSYPYLFLSAHSDFPQLKVYRGRKQTNGRYFGPYPNARSMHDTLDILQRLFKIRSCQDISFKNRSRPCLQYQIKRCSAPCVGYIDKTQYQEDVNQVTLFLEGKSTQVIDVLANKMEHASEALDFEKAAVYRDHITYLRRIQETQHFSHADKNVDVVVVLLDRQLCCVTVLSIRKGVWMGTRSYFPRVPENITADEALTAFLPQYYLYGLEWPSPQTIYTSHAGAETQWIAASLSEQWGYPVHIQFPKRLQEKKWLEIAWMNAQQSLESHRSPQARYKELFVSFQEVFQLGVLPHRLECFDISHLQGEATVASCVVFGIEGPVKEEYRRFTIQGITKGDDYAAMTQSLMRHYTSLLREGKRLPDVLIVDGGQGQLNCAGKVLHTLGIESLCVVGIAKGPSRKSGLETVLVWGQEGPISLKGRPAFYLLQHIRDEAHRFAITGHRRLRQKERRISRLEEIPGIGPKRRMQLLRLFGGFQEICSASEAALCQVPGINAGLAKRIYEDLHRGKK